jgi:hypothetical protein
METIVERPAGLDVHKAQVTACVRTPAADVPVSSSALCNRLASRARSWIWVLR